MSSERTTPLSVPVGYRFHPTEEELVNHYLKKKVHGGNDSEINQVIPEIDLCKYEPAELPALLGTETEAHDMEWFFFTRRAYKYNKSSRSNRSTKKGYWKITGKERGIKARRSKAVIGMKKTLTFYQGRVPKSKKTSWVIHECYLPGNGVIKQTQGDFVICRLKIRSDKKDSSVSNEGEPGSASVSEMNQEGNEELLFHQPQPLDDCCSSALQSPVSQKLEAVLQTNVTNDDCNELQSPFGDSDSCLLDGNEVSTCDENEAVYDVFPQLRDLPDQNLDSLFGPLQPQECCHTVLQSPIYTKLRDVPHPLQPQEYCPSILQSPIYTKLQDVLHPPQPQDYEPSKFQSPIYTKLGSVPHPLQPQDYQPSKLQLPIYTKLGTVPDANLYCGECNNWQFAVKKNVSTDEVGILVRQIMSNFENQATDFKIPEVHHPQTKGNLESVVYPFQPQNFTSQPLMYTEFGDALHNTESNELQSSFGDNDSSLTKFLNTNFAYQDCYSVD
ncbi:putative transcription factor NAM family [Rosa chinensis]|uniref:Putative transcription factor NAM family n=1 Tax=Rosa chinensis TaxID=74649 RepID=A0A2P6SC39_ROSCH|nr:NAC domain-containing protein 89 isoform X2 [Rosa chinensis]PRQ56253.1 putative transcription factor NAM family [Rosa chinensis]